MNDVIIKDGAALGDSLDGKGPQLDRPIRELSEEERMIRFLHREHTLECKLKSGLVGRRPVDHNTLDNARALARGMLAEVADAVEVRIFKTRSWELVEVVKR